MLEVGAFAAKGLHAIAKPQDYGALGHYRPCLPLAQLRPEWPQTANSSRCDG